MAMMTTRDTFTSKTNLSLFAKINNSGQQAYLRLALSADMPFMCFGDIHWMCMRLFPAHSYTRATKRGLTLGGRLIPLASEHYFSHDAAYTACAAHSYIEVKKSNLPASE
jgi:hypothetical protein